MTLSSLWVALIVGGVALASPLLTKIAKKGEWGGMIVAWIGIAAIFAVALV